MNDISILARMQSNTRRAFTLVELLVVIAIIGVLVALLLPAVQAAREAARRTHCVNNMKQLTLGNLNYESAKRVFPPGGITPGPCCDTRSYTNWAIESLPYIEHQALYDIFRQKPNYIEDNINQPVVQTKVAPHSCPSDMNTEFVDNPETGFNASNRKYRMSSYRACAGRAVEGQGVFTGPNTTIGKPSERGVFPTAEYMGLQPTRIKQITDGLSKTLMIGESASRKRHPRNTMWAYTYASHNKAEIFNEPQTLLDDYDECEAISKALGKSVHPCKRMWSSQHPGGFHFSLCDGSVAFISSEVDIYLLCDLASIAGSENSSLP